MEKVKLLFRKKSVKIVLCTVVIIAGLVLLAMFAWFNAAKTTATWDGYTQTEPAGSGTKDDPFLIANGSNLAWVAEMTNIQADYIRGKYFKQTANIDLCNKVWVPIGRDVNYSFQGTYDGENYNITTTPEDMLKVKDALSQIGVEEFLESEVTYIPNMEVEVDDEHKEKVLELIEQLEDLDDVQSVYFNMKD